MSQPLGSGIGGKQNSETLVQHTYLTKQKHNGRWEIHNLASILLALGMSDDQQPKRNHAAYNRLK